MECDDVRGVDGLVESSEQTQRRKLRERIAENFLYPSVSLRRMQTDRGPS